MSKLRSLTFGGNLSKTDILEPSKSVTFNMERADGYKNISYDFTFTITHTNTTAVLSTNIYKFLRNFLLNMKFVTGAGDNLFDLSSNEMAIIHLVEQGRLRYDIKTAVAADLKSTIMIRWNFILPDGYENPLDTVFHSDSRKYNNVQVKMTPQKAFDSVTNCEISNIDVSIKEVFKLNPTAKTVIRNDGKVGQLPPLNKVIKVKDFAYNSNVTSQVIELPKDTTILGVYLYVENENQNIISGAINNISIKNGNTYFYDSSFTEANEDNRDNLKVWGNSLLNDIAYVDIAKGQISEALSTASAEHSNTHLSLDLTAVGSNNIVKLMFLTVEDA